MGDVFSGFGQLVLQTVLPSLLTALVGILIEIARRELQRRGVVLSQERWQWLRDRALEAVLVIEERVRRGEIVNAPDVKHAAALDLVMQQSKKVDEAKANQAIDAALPHARATLIPSTPATFGQPRSAS